MRSSLRLNALQMHRQHVRDVRRHRAARTGVSAFDGDARKRLFKNDLRALAAAAQDRPSLEHMLGAVSMPCFIYAGGADKDLTQARNSATRIAEARFTVFPDLSHGETLDRSDLVLPDAVRFLEHALESR